TEAVIPQGSPQARLVLVPADARYLLETLPGLPGADEEPAPVTLDLGRQSLLRARSEQSCTELLLAASRSSGRPARVSLARKLLVRALAMGFCELELYGPAKPLVARAEGRLWVA